MPIQPEKEIFYRRLEEINLEKLLNIGFIFIFGVSHFDDYLDSLAIINFNKVRLITFFILVTFTIVIVLMHEDYGCVMPFVICFFREKL